MAVQKTHRGGAPARVFHRAHTVVTVLTAVTLLTLGLSNIIPPHRALSYFLMIELPLLVVFVILSGMRLRKVIQHKRATGTSFTDALLQEEPLLKPAVFELRAYRHLWLALRHQRFVPEGAVAFSYTKGSYSIPTALMAASMIEMVALHFLIPWQWLRIVLVLVNVWGVLLLLGMIAGRTVRPHLVTGDELQVQWGHSSVLRTPVANIRSVTKTVNYLHHQPHIDGGRLFLCSFQSPNVLLEFTAPVPTDPPVGRKKKPKDFRASSIHLFVDDPDCLVNTIRGIPIAPVEPQEHNGAS